MKPLVSIIILNFNGLKYLGTDFLTRCISSVLKSDYPNFQVILADNASSDESVKFIETNFVDSRLKIVRYSKNHGFAEGNNMALKYAQGDYIILLNSDVEVEPNWIQALLDVLEENPRVGIAQSKIMNIDRITVQTMGNLFDPSFTVFTIGTDQVDTKQFNKICDISFACGASLIIRRTVIEKIGLFDTEYFWYHDDSDLCLRAQLAGFKIVSVPCSIVYHKGSGTSKGAFKRNQDLFYYLSSQIGLLIKNTELKNFPKNGLNLFTSIVPYIILILLQGEMKTPIRLIGWTFKTFKHNWSWHLRANQLRKITDKELFSTFLDSSIINFRMKRVFYQLTGQKNLMSLEIYANKKTLDFYRKHSH